MNLLSVSDSWKGFSVRGAMYKNTFLIFSFSYFGKFGTSDSIWILTTARFSEQFFSKPFVSEQFSLKISSDKPSCGLALVVPCHQFELFPR
jgi:hypothetical protein